MTVAIPAVATRLVASYVFRDHLSITTTDCPVGLKFLHHHVHLSSSLEGTQAYSPSEGASNLGGFHGAFDLHGTNLVSHHCRLGRNIVFVHEHNLVAERGGNFFEGLLLRFAEKQGKKYQSKVNTDVGNGGHTAERADGGDGQLTGSRSMR
jgi:hypothetical protein